MDFNCGQYPVFSNPEEPEKFFPELIYLEEIGLPPMSYEDYAQAEIDLAMNDLSNTAKEFGFHDDSFLPDLPGPLP